MNGHLLIGAGGHAQSVVDAVLSNGHTISAYVDPSECPWIGPLTGHTVRQFPTDADAFAGPRGDIVLGVGGVTPDALHRRLSVLDRYCEAGFSAAAVRHATACLGRDAVLDPGVTVMAGAVIQTLAKIGRGAIVNSGAIVEHGAVVGPGAHIAPGAVVLGQATIGAHAMIGAGSVILPQAVVEDGAMIKALTRFG